MKSAVHHAFVLAACMAGIIGFGLVYEGLSSGFSGSIYLGIPLLAGGLWWSGKALGQSNLAAKRRRLLRSYSNR